MSESTAKDAKIAESRSKAEHIVLLNEKWIAAKEKAKEYKTMIDDAIDDLVAHDAAPVQMSIFDGDE